MGAAAHLRWQAALHRWQRSVRGWPVWTLSSPLRGYVVTIIVLYGAAVAASASSPQWRPHQALVAGMLLAVGAVTMEACRRIGEPATAGKDANGVWELAIAIVLPPFYALVAPAVMLALTQWRVRRTLAYRRVFSAAAVGLSYGAASLTFHLLIFVVPWIILLQRSTRQAQLSNAAHTDTVTGLPCAPAWRREAAVQVTRAHRRGDSVAVAIISLDGFAEVVASHGRAVADAALLDVADVIVSGTRKQDLAGRFGDAEFTLLLPRADATRALAVARRLQERLAAIHLGEPGPRSGRSGAGTPGSGTPGSGTAGAGVPRPEVSRDTGRVSACIGLAFLVETMTDVTDLLTAADTALHRAKRARPGSIRFAAPP
jgi:diguanylate cyclase (GGDEF)-like protein